MSLAAFSICPLGGERNENGSVKPVLKSLALQYCLPQACHCGICKWLNNIADKYNLVSLMANIHINYYTAQNIKEDYLGNKQSAFI